MSACLLLSSSVSHTALHLLKSGLHLTTFFQSCLFNTKIHCCFSYRQKVGVTISCEILLHCGVFLLSGCWQCHQLISFATTPVVCSLAVHVPVTVMQFSVGRIHLYLLYKSLHLSQSYSLSLLLLQWSVCEAAKTNRNESLSQVKLKFCIICKTHKMQIKKL